MSCGRRRAVHTAGTIPPARRWQRRTASTQTIRA